MKNKLQQPTYSINCIFDDRDDHQIDISSHFSALGILKASSATIIANELLALSNKDDDNISPADTFVFIDAHGGEDFMELHRYDVIRLDKLGLLEEYIDETLRTWTQNSKMLDFAYLLYEDLGDLYDYVVTHKPTVTRRATWQLNDGPLELELYVDRIVGDRYMVGASLYRDGDFNADTAVSVYYASADRATLDEAASGAFCAAINRAFMDENEDCVKAIILSLKSDDLVVLEDREQNLEPGVADLVRLQRTCLSAKASTERDAPGLAL